jgi:hypothetical protein
MALVMLPVALVAGLLIGDGRRARIVTAAIWTVLAVALLAAALGGLEASPWEALVLLICLPISLLIANWAAGLRHRTAT